MAFDAPSLAKRIEAVGVSEMELPQAVAREAAFHLTDWLSDLAKFNQFCSLPDTLSDEEVNSLLLAFLVHVPNHLAAAAKLYAEMPVTDIFGAGATSEDITK